MLEIKDLHVKAGDKVIFGQYSGNTVKVDGEELLIMSEAEIRGPAPRLGEANQYILSDLLGIDQAKLTSLADDWTIGDLPEGGGAPGAECWRGAQHLPPHRADAFFRQKDSFLDG